MTGPRPAARPWTRAEVAQLIAAGVKIGLIARKPKRCPGAIAPRISSLKKTPRELTFDVEGLSLFFERLAFAYENSQSSHPV